MMQFISPSDRDCNGIKQKSFAIFKLKSPVHKMVGFLGLSSLKIALDISFKDLMLNCK